VLLDDRLHTLVNTLRLVEFGSVFGRSYGKKTESTNGVDRIVGVCPIYKLRKTSSLPTSHTNLPTHGRRLDLRSEEANKQATLRLYPYAEGDRKRAPLLDQIY
jgi:hypothetical protein